MPANEFEKKVQEKMEELQLSPHAEVWEEVERRIRKENKRKGGFYWLILAGLLLGGGGIAFFNLNKEKKSKIAVSSKKDPHNTVQQPAIIEPVGNKTDAITRGSDTMINAGENKLSGIQADKKKSPVTPVLKNTKQRDKIESRPNNVTRNKIKKKQTVLPKEAGTLLDKDQPARVQKQENIQPVQPVIAINELPNKNDTVLDTVTAVVDAGTNKEEDQEVLAGPVKNPVEASVVPEPGIAKDKKTKKREWGFLVQGGISNNVKRLHFFDSRVYASSLALSGPSGASSGRTPALIRPGVSFSAGIYTTQPLSPKLKLNTDLTYSYLSTRMKVGSQADTSGMSTNPNSPGLEITRFYRGSGNLEPISNQFHFFSLSSELSWRIINRDRFTLYWDNGINYKWLFASRVLHYDWGFKGYYQDPRLLTHHHLFISTGLSFPVSRGITIHPFAEYSLTRVMRHNSDSLRTHFTNYGIRIKFSLREKK